MPLSVCGATVGVGWLHSTPLHNKPNQQWHCTWKNVRGASTEPRFSRGIDLSESLVYVAQTGTGFDNYMIISFSPSELTELNWTDAPKTPELHLYIKILYYHISGGTIPHRILYSSLHVCRAFSRELLISGLPLHFIIYVLPFLHSLAYILTWPIMHNQIHSSRNDNNNNNNKIRSWDWVRKESRNVGSRGVAGFRVYLCTGSQVTRGLRLVPERQSPWTDRVFILYWCKKLTWTVDFYVSDLESFSLPYSYGGGSS